MKMVTQSVKVTVMFTTDKCYENREQILGCREMKLLEDMIHIHRAKELHN